MKLLTDIKPLLNGPRQRIVFTMHQRPDADAMGSTLACYDYLRQKGHDVTVIAGPLRPRGWPRPRTRCSAARGRSTVRGVVIALSLGTVSS